MTSNVASTIKMKKRLQIKMSDYSYKYTRDPRGISDKVVSDNDDFTNELMWCSVVKNNLVDDCK